MDGVLRQESEIADGKRPLPAGGPQALENRCVLGVVGEIPGLIGVLVQVVELLGRLGLPEVGARRAQLSLGVHLVPNGGRRRAEHVLDELAVDPVRHEVADVDVALVADATDHVVALVHAAAKAVKVRLRRSFVPAREGVALEMVRRLGAGEAEHRRREVDETGETAALPARGVLGRPQVPELLRDVQDQRHAAARSCRSSACCGAVPTPWSAQ